MLGSIESPQKCDSLYNSTTNNNFFQLKMLCLNGILYIGTWTVQLDLRLINLFGLAKYVYVHFQFKCA